MADAFEYASICHCADCRRATGSAFKPFAGITREMLEITGGNDAILRHGEGEAHDMHCGRCGSLLYSAVREGRYVHVAMGTLIDDPTIRPAEHIFVSMKAPWDIICDGLPQYARHVFEGPPINAAR